MSFNFVSLQISMYERVMKKACIQQIPTIHCFQILKNEQQFHLEFVLAICMNSRIYSNDHNLKVFSNFSDISLRENLCWLRYNGNMIRKILGVQVNLIFT